MYTGAIAVVPLNQAVINSTSTVSNASVDLGPYFNVMRREAILVYTYTNTSTALVADQVVSGRLEGSDTSSTANSTTVTMTTVTGSTFTSTGSTLANLPGILTANVQLTQRYVRFAVVGAGTLPIVPTSAALVLFKRAG